MQKLVFEILKECGTPKPFGWLFTINTPKLKCWSMQRKYKTMQMRSGWGWFCMVLGLYPVAIATELWPVDAAAVHAPMWVIFLCGVVFLMGGAMILIDRNAKISGLCATILFMSMGAIGAWVAVLGPSVGFSGGIPFLPNEYNVMFARWVFGCGALISFMMSAYAIRTLLKPRA